ncbi:MAG TPA: hypothetical protein VM537_15295 [Anaerolineae bacterium]|nr:hypothetical protein [Anaerolineae bacterium]
MRDIADNIEQECCTEGCGCDAGGSCAVPDCAFGCNDSGRDELAHARAQWEREYRDELARLQKRVAELEEQGRAHASRQICALSTEIDSLERNILGRPVTSSQLKKAGMEVLGVDKKS